MPSGSRVRRGGSRYLYIAPAFILYAAFNLWPLVQGANISLFHWDGITDGHLGGPVATTRTSSPTRLIREGYLHVLQLMVFYAFLPIVHRAVPGGRAVADPDPRPDGRSGCCCSCRS